MLNHLASISIAGFHTLHFSCQGSQELLARDDHSVPAFLLEEDVRSGDEDEAVVATARRQGGRTGGIERAKKPWGHREFGAVDPNGVRVGFFQELGQAPPSN